MLQGVACTHVQYEMDSLGFKKKRESLERARERRRQEVGRGESGRSRGGGSEYDQKTLNACMKLPKY